MLEKSSSEARMIALADEMHVSIITLAGSRADCDNRESMIARAARRAGISFRQAKSFYYREAANPAAAAVEAVRRALPCPEPVEAQLDRIARLEAELTELRHYVASTLAGVAGQAPAQSQRSLDAPGAAAGHGDDRASLSDRALAEAARPQVATALARRSASPTASSLYGARRSLRSQGDRL